MKLSMNEEGYQVQTGKHYNDRDDDNNDVAQQRQTKKFRLYT